ncbi:MAG: FHA domain-containing protein [Armatimonadetes bacterium]|nr:FHA domain-containing protein [Armatimonadota bacterium]CUU36710.1 FHA domain-containing protein [Armatimonadetes bacterium DC]
MQGETTVAVGATQAMAAPGATQAIAPVQCPICGQVNPVGEIYCVECGFLLSSAPPEEQAPQGAYPKLRDATGREFLLKAGENLIGRDPASDVLLTDGTVSRRHARILIEDNTAFIEDLGSTNGTKLNGQPLTVGERVPLPPQAELQFGSVVLTLELPEGFTTAVVAEEVAPPLAFLVNKEDPSQRFPLYARSQKIGRRAGNDIVIPDPYVSGQHAAIEIVGDEVRITDLGSTNGTFINEMRIVPNQPTPIPQGATLTLGKSQFVIEWNTHAETPEAPSEDADATPAQDTPQSEA